MNKENDEAKITSNTKKTNNLLKENVVSKRSTDYIEYLNEIIEKDENNIPIDKFEYVFEDNNSNQKKIQYKNHYYKTKLKKSKKIKNKNENKYINEKKIYNVKKSWLNKNQTQKNKEEQNHKISPYSFKYFYKNENKKTLHKSQSSNNKEINNMESNFIKLCREANIYTSNASYIKNKKMLLFDKFNYDNNIYKPDRAKLFDLTRIKNIPNKKSFIYKTTKFRAGHFIPNSNSGIGNQSGNLFLNNTSLYDNNKNNNYEKCLQFRNFSNTIMPSTYIDKSFQNNKRHRPSDTLYNQLMGKKNETLELFLKKNLSNEKNNQDKKMEKDISKEKSEENDNTDETLLYSFYKNPNTKTKIYNITNIRKLYYKQIAKNNSDLNFKGYSSLLSKKKNNLGQPLSFPKIFSANITFDNRSQKERYEKICQSFSKLKELISEFKKEGKLSELDYIYEYCLDKNIDKKYLTISNLNNFYNFLQEKKLPLDLSKSLKENIILALEFDKKKYKNQNKKKEEKKNASNIYMKKLNMKNFDKKRNNNNENKSKEQIDIKPLMIDLERQNKINNQENFSMSDRITIKNELKKELDLIKNEVINKQKIIQKYRKKDRNESNESKMEKIQKIEEKVFDSNERLYYTWYKNNSYNINNFVKKRKLTELYFYNRTKEKIRHNDIEKEYFN